MIEKDNIRENKEIDFYIDKKEQKQERQKKIDKKLNDIWILINVVFIISQLYPINLVRLPIPLHPCNNVQLFQRPDPCVSKNSVPEFCGV